MSDFQETEVLTSRSDRRCYECGRDRIRRGKPYAYTSGRFDGCWFKIRVCLRCHNAWQALHRRGALRGRYEEDFQTLREELRDFREERQAETVQ